MAAAHGLRQCIEVHVAEHLYCAAVPSLHERAQQTRSWSSRACARRNRSWPHRDVVGGEESLQIADRNRAGMKHAGCKRAIDIGIAEYVAEMLRRSGAAGSHERHLAH